ncbi:PIN domain-containing protein (plasmid) [Streptomyces sp. Q6]|uniref:PIN domain-containing protein n=1 Tax=Streptomyces citrinus TaxID=3118173 RepID=A0ACD5AQH2_9ACTN
MGISRDHGRPRAAVSPTALRRSRDCGRWAVRRQPSTRRPIRATSSTPAPVTADVIAHTGLYGTTRNPADSLRGTRQDRGMLISPYPGAHRNNLRQNLDRVRVAAENLRNSHDGDYLFEYLEWASTSARLLHHQVRDADIRNLVYTDGYRRIVDGSSYMGEYTTNDQRRFLFPMIDLELQHRVEDLQAACDDLFNHSRRWSGRTVLAVADTSFYIQHPTKLEETNLAALLSATGSTVQLLAPIVVIDELDRLKEAGKEHARWRAGYTLAVLDKILSAEGVGRLTTPDGKPTKTTVEVLFDAPSHTRLTDVDDEIVDRTRAIKDTAAAPVTLITYDTGQALRARTRGVAVLKLRHDLSAEEPNRARETKPGTGLRAQRRARNAQQQDT